MPFNCCRLEPGQISSQSPIGFKINDISVLVALPVTQTAVDHVCLFVAWPVIQHAICMCSAMSQLTSERFADGVPFDTISRAETIAALVDCDMSSAVDIGGHRPGRWNRPMPSVWKNALAKGDGHREHHGHSRSPLWVCSSSG